MFVLRYGIEQEYTLLQTNVKWPLGWPVGGYPGPQVISFSNLSNAHKNSLYHDMDLILVLLYIRVLITALPGQISLLAVIYQMLITRLAYMLELTSVEPMGRLCLARFSSQHSLSYKDDESLRSEISCLTISFITTAVGVSSWS